MKKISTLLLLLVLASSCGFSSGPKEEASSTRPSDELEFAVDTIEPQPSSEIKVEEQKISEQKMPDEIAPIADKTEKPIEKPIEERILASNEAKEPEMVAPEEPQFKDYKKDSAPTNMPVITKDETFEPKLGAEGQYHVQKGETLMMASFKIYGDYRKWKDLKAWNKGKKIGEGTVLKYYVPDQTFGWQPNGLPYLVKNGDTLQVISMDKYGTTKKWKHIYENNRPLIRDPNLIFAGFTIYYVPTRDVASEPR
jgi:nucleoid-associated protein YgaU